jgi:hypothetical protein
VVRRGPELNARERFGENYGRSFSGLESVAGEKFQNYIIFLILLF